MGSLTRTAAAVCLAMAVCVARADRLLRMPTAFTIGFRSASVEFAVEPDKPGHERTWLQLGLTDRLELRSEISNPPFAPPIGTLDAEYNLYEVVPGLLPGLSVGVSDLFGQTPRGVGFYAVMTQTLIIEGRNSTGRDFVFHLGVGFGGIRGLMVGFELPVSPSMSLVVEHDSWEVNAAIQWQPIKNLRLRGVAFERRLHIGVSAAFDL